MRSNMDTTSELEWLRSPRGEVCLQGGQVTNWRHDDAEVLFVSRKARFERGQSIRGGVPVIFPWFGDDPEKRGRGAHGFARKLPWRVVRHAAAPGGETVELELVDDGATRAVWPHRFVLRLAATLGDELDVALTVENRDDHAFDCELALHSYFRVGDVRAITLSGLQGARYLDKLDGFREKVASAEPLTFDGPIDNVYLDTEATCEIEDIIHGRTLDISKQGSRSTVVWNPWVEGTARLADLGAEDWVHFLCVETANVGANRLRVEPGASHVMRLRVAVR